MSKKEKTKFVCLKHLELALIYDKLRISKFQHNIPYFYASKNKDGELSLNIFDNAGNFDYRKIKYVKITAVKTIIDGIDRNKYKMKGKEIKISSPDKKAKEDIHFVSSALTIPIEIFEVMLADSRNCIVDSADAMSETRLMIDKTKLSNILWFVTSAYGIKLLDKDKKKLAYAVQLVD